MLLPDQYDHGGVSGGTLERPVLKRLLADIDSGPVDQNLVYTVDRLTQSLSDSAQIVDGLDAAEASSVSVIQSFSPATSLRNPSKWPLDGHKRPYWLRCRRLQPQD